MLYKIYIGVGKKPFPNLAYVDADQEALSYFGRFTKVYATGGWKADNGKVAYENSLMYEIVTGDINAVRAFAAGLCGLFEQEAVLVVGVLTREELVGEEKGA